jgi:hypothetical protein
VKRSIKRVRILAGAGLFLLAAGGLLIWIDKSIQERDRLRIELAEERLRLQRLEQVWSGKLEECEMRTRRLAVKTSARSVEYD